MLAQQRGSSGAHVALSDGVTIAILHEDDQMALAGTALSALRVAGHARSRGITSDVLILDNASGDDALRLARQIEALYYADGVALLAFARRQTPADIRNNALRHARGRYIVLVPAAAELDAATLGMFYEAIVAARSAVAYGYVTVDSRRVGAILPSVGTRYRADHRPVGSIPHLALLDRLQILDAGGYVDVPGNRYAVDWECYAHLAAVGRHATFVPLPFGAISSGDDR